MTIDGVGIREAVIMTRHLYPVYIQGPIQDFWKGVHIYKGGGGGVRFADFISFFLKYHMKMK